MSLDCGKKPEYLEGTHTCTRRKANSTQKEPLRLNRDSSQEPSEAPALTTSPPNAGKTRYTEEQQVIYRDLPLPIPTDPAFKVDVGRIQCPLLLVVGEDDQNWPAHESATDMKEMMERAGNSHLLTVLSYPNAGHLIEPPYTLHSRASLFESGRLRREVIALWGGETVAHSHAQEDAWRKTLVFLRENLYRGTNPGAASVSNL
uniref:peroxisomal succinyl-coenzyme A thioesterase-like n=1 Tax=Semicossyphus pulcher TaxID=241346 RepID=UPI0037E72217